MPQYRARARDSCYWPGLVYPCLSAELEPEIAATGQMPKLKNDGKLPRLPGKHEEANSSTMTLGQIPERPWAQVASDIFNYIRNTT